MTDTKIAPLSRSLRIHGKTPHVQHRRMSYSMLLRDRIVSLLKQMAVFNTFQFATNRAKPIQPESLPYCGVYFMSETCQGGLEPQSGVVEQRLLVRFGFSVIILDNDRDASEYMLDRMYQAITSLMRMPELHSFSAPLVRVQGFTGSSRQHIFAAAGQNNETPYAELQYEMICDLGTETFDPEITDDFEVLHVTVNYPYGSDAPPIIVEYDVQQE